MRKLVAVLAAVAAAMLIVPALASARDTALTAKLSGSNERPDKGDKNGTGFAAVVTDDTANQVCFVLAWDKIGTPIMAHIHRGGRNVAGPVVVLFFMGTPKKAACVSAPHALVTSIAKKPKNYYVNIHTTAFPAGAIRGQLKRA
jgi:CHRD domain-containing protein